MNHMNLDVTSHSEKGPVHCLTSIASNCPKESPIKCEVEKQSFSISYPSSSVILFCSRALFHILFFSDKRMQRNMQLPLRRKWLLLQRHQQHPIVTRQHSNNLMSPVRYVVLTINIIYQINSFAFISSVLEQRD